MENNITEIFGDQPGLDRRSVEFLAKALAKNNLPGFDYLEFKQSLARLKELGMDTSTVFKSAFATASTVGLTKDKLLTTAAHYKQVLAQEKRQFDSAMENQINRRVKGKQEEAEKLKKQIDEWRKQIEHLQQRMNQAQETIDSSDSHIKRETEKIHSTRDNFEKTFRSIQQQIDEDIADINTYL